jgi:hypothetical protein
VRKFKDLRREIWEGENGRRTRMDLGKTLNTPNKVKEGSTLYDPDTTPQAIWSG